MPKWLLPTLSEILTLNDPTWAAASPRCLGAQQDSRAGLQVRAEREWHGAIASLTAMLQNQMTESASTPQGLVLSGPLPVLSQPEVMANVAAWTLTVSAFDAPAWLPLQLLPARGEGGIASAPPPILPLLPGDPLAAEQFCLALTPWFSLVLVLGETLAGEPSFMFSFMPEVVQQAWQAIRPRILLMNSSQVEQLDDWVEQFPPIAPDYRTVMEFSRLLLENLPEPIEESEASERSRVSIPLRPMEDQPLPPAPDVELLQAIAHEVRTPLATIRTLTRLLLRRKDLPPDVLKRLGIIDRECSEQIDRFGLIFKAVELETDAARQGAMFLTRTPLGQVLQDSIPRWQQQATQRSLTLDVVMPQRMPAVVSDPSMLDQALTSLIERYTRSLPAGSHIQVEASLAGSQLKLQLQSQPEAHPAIDLHQSPLKSIGQLLMFQPETGSLSLNLSVTKNLFQAIGGRLIVRQRPQQGEVMTVFLPLEGKRDEG
ncbi:MAG TPA: histidine kinase dimerization/phospho-acceptor domain-containing protein [Thermosynechococcaceae cyanobacterium]